MSGQPHGVPDLINFLKTFPGFCSPVCVVESDYLWRCGSELTFGLLEFGECRDNRLIKRIWLESVELAVAPASRKLLVEAYVGPVPGTTCPCFFYFVYDGYSHVFNWFLV